MAVTHSWKAASTPTDQRTVRSSPPTTAKIYSEITTDPYALHSSYPISNDPRSVRSCRHQAPPCQIGRPPHPWRKSALEERPPDTAQDPASVARQCPVACRPLSFALEGSRGAGLATRDAGLVLSWVADSFILPGHDGRYDPSKLPPQGLLLLLKKRLCQFASVHIRVDHLETIDSL